jgi:CBS domain-containing protein
MKDRIGVEDDQNTYLIDISDDDVLAAMKQAGGYLDITFNDFKELYHIACNHAVERLMFSVTARDIMTEKVVTVTRKTAAKEVAEIMARHNVSGVPVLDDTGQLVGIISEKDFMTRMGGQPGGSFMHIISGCLHNRGCSAAPIRNELAEDIMTSPVITAAEDTPVAEIVNLFAEKKVNRLPVINAEKQLTGIVSRADALQTVIPRIKK